MIEQDWISILTIKILLVEVVAYTWGYMVINMINKKESE